MIRGEIICRSDLNFERQPKPCVCVSEGLFSDEIPASEEQLFAFLSKCKDTFNDLRMDDLGKIHSFLT